MKQSDIEYEAFGRRLNKRAEKAEREWIRKGGGEWKFERVVGISCLLFSSTKYRHAQQNIGSDDVGF